jgi:arginyl-tRNA synthetase
MMPDTKAAITARLHAARMQVAPESAQTPILLERPKQAEHGDLSCNIAMQLAKALKANPRQIAEQIVAALQAQAQWADGLISAAEIAGAGFINLRLSIRTKHAVITQVLNAPADWGRSARTQENIQVEYVSANPTGPLHIGHGRGAAYGASLANVLAAAGATVTREFYINDAGRQMDILALSVWLRYLEARDRTVAFPADGYRGAYVRDIALALNQAHAAQLERDDPRFAAALQAAAQSEQVADDEAVRGDAALDALIALARELLATDWRVVHGFALQAMLADQQDDLAQFGVTYAHWFSEQSLHDSGQVARAVAQLESAGHTYIKDGALWFRSTTFGDEKDRVIRRENGLLTYFASDIAYHLDKFSRGFDRVINVWGADHHGYIARVKGALLACGVHAQRLTVALVQFAALFRGGEKVAMGKRSGEFVTLRDLRREVGNDAARFFYVLRKSDQHLDFDLDLAKSQSNDNPVYYVQYAHARVCSIFVQAKRDAQSLHSTPLSPLEGARELALMQRIGEFPELIQTAARELAPHLIAFYLRELAADFHAFYNAERILVEDAALSEARLALCAATRYTLANGLALLGVSAPERM